MTFNIRKKRMRGTKTHGWGSKKKHRGAGNRGGRGMAGAGKRAEHKKTLILKKYTNAYFGKKGSFSIRKKSKQPEKIINIVDYGDAMSNNLGRFQSMEEKIYFETSLYL